MDLASDGDDASTRLFAEVSQPLRLAVTAGQHHARVQRRGRRSQPLRPPRRQQADTDDRLAHQLAQPHGGRRRALQPVFERIDVERPHRPEVAERALLVLEVPRLGPRSAYDGHIVHVSTLFGPNLLDALVVVGSGLLVRTRLLDGHLPARTSVWDELVPFDAFDDPVPSGCCDTRAGWELDPLDLGRLPDEPPKQPRQILICPGPLRPPEQVVAAYAQRLRHRGQQPAPEGP